MATQSTQPSLEASKIDLRVSPYERVSGWLTALNILVGFFVGWMFLLWLTTVLVFTKEQVEVVLVENIAGRGDHAKGYERDIEAPGIEELEEEVEPQVEQLLEAVTDMVSSQAAALDNMPTEAVTSNVGKGLGDSRPPGPLGEGDDAIPRWERWVIQYTTTSLEAYAAQLDHFKIELGAAGGGTPQVDYASDLGRPKPSRRAGDGDKERRLYFTWTAGELRKFDKKLLSNAGIKTTRRVWMQFYPANVENRLANLEMNYGKTKGHSDYREFARTVFEVRRKGSGFEYAVVSQKYRVPRW